MEPIAPASCRAYATQKNADLGGSGFLGHVQLRGARGRVWLDGRRMPTGRLWAHAGGRVIGFMWWLYWQGALLFLFNWMRDLQSPGRRARFDETCDGPHVWLTCKTRPETASWRVVESRLVSSVLVSHMSGSTLEVQLDVPLGRKGGMARLYLEVSGTQRDTVMGVLSGSQTIASAGGETAAQDGGAEAAPRT